MELAFDFQLNSWQASQGSACVHARFMLLSEKINCNQYKSNKLIGFYIYMIGE